MTTAADASPAARSSGVELAGSGRRALDAVVLVAIVTVVVLVADATVEGGRPSSPAGTEPAPGVVAVDTGRPLAQVRPVDGLVEDADVLWTVPDAVTVPAADRVGVVAAGPEHVLVGDRLVVTSGADARDGRVLPAAIHGAISKAGRWAVAEAGGITFGHVDRDETVHVPVDDGWRPVGPARTWWLGVPVFHDTDGRIGAVDLAGGLVRWVTDDPVGPVVWRDGVAYGVGPSGDAVEVRLSDGAVRDRRGAHLPVLVADGVAVEVTADDEVVARGRHRWTARVDGADSGRWHRTADGLVLVSEAAAELLDPRDGRSVARLAVADGLPVAGGVVASDGDAVTLRRWDGTDGWTWSPAGPVPAVVRPIDDARVAVEHAERDGGVAVAILSTLDGRVLARVGGSERPGRQTPAIAAAVGDLVGLKGTRLSGTAGLEWIDVARGVVDPEGAAAALGGGDLSGWRFAGVMPPGSDDATPVLVRRAGPGVEVRIGDRVHGVEVSPHGIGVRRPLVGASTLTFAATGSGTGIVLVDADTGAATRVPGVLADRAIGSVQLATEGPSDPPLGRIPVAAELLALDPATGDEWWRATSIGATGPALDGPDVVGPLTARGREHVVEVGLTALRARSSGSGAVRWTRSTPAPIVRSPVVAGATVVAPLVDGTVVAFGADVGDIRWRATVGVASAVAATSVGTAVGTSAGEVVLLDPVGAVVDRWTVDDRAVIDLAAVGDVLVVVTSGGVIGLAVPGG